MALMTRNSELLQQVDRSIQASNVVKQKLLDSPEILSAGAEVSDILIEAIKKGNKPILFGNGGSAADAQHIAAEFVGRFALDRPAMPALALSANTSCVTAIGNDYGFDRAFARQVEALGALAMWLSEFLPAGTRPPGAAGCRQNGAAHGGANRSRWRQIERRGRSLYLRPVERHATYSGMPYTYCAYHLGTGRVSDFL
jgi:hypothetical protein